MGGGSWSNDAVRARTRTRRSMPQQRVFTSTRLHEGLSPKGLVVRESRDSDEHPESVAIIFDMDITGSMRNIPKLLATEILGDLMPSILPYDADAQLLFAAVGDADDGHRSEAPWQNGQWESDDKLADQWLTKLWLDGSGGSRPYESYDLAFYFAARLTSIDCYEKRGRRGYLFITGDDICRDRVRASTVNALLGRDELTNDVPIQEILAEAADKFHIFFLIPDQRRCQDYVVGTTVIEHWQRLLGDHGSVIGLHDPRDTAVAAAMLFGLTEGHLRDLDAVREELKTRHKFTQSRQDRVIKAIRDYADSLRQSGQRAG